MRTTIAALALGISGALSHASAQQPFEFYGAAGASYSLGPDRFATLPATGRGITFDQRDYGGAAPSGFIGVRTRFDGFYIGVEGDFLSRADAGRSQTVQGTTFSGIPFSETFKSRLSDRYGASIVAAVPIGGIEVFARAGLTYSELTETYSVGAVGPSFVSSTCAPSAPGSFSFVCTPVTSTTDPVSVRRRIDFGSPVLAGGIQVPLGMFFARVEAEAEFLSLPRNELNFDRVTRFSNGAPSTVAPWSVVATSSNERDIGLRLSTSVGVKF